MQQSEYAAIWIDHTEARIFHIELGKAELLTVTAPQHLHPRHPKGRNDGKEHPDDAKHFFAEVVKSLVGVRALLIVGPSTGKLDLMRYIHQHAHALEPAIVGVETVDHPTDGQLVAYAKKYFKLDEQS